MAEQTELIERMKAALAESKLQIEELVDMVRDLTSPPLKYGIVAQTGRKTEIPRAAKKSDFKKGVKVRIKAEYIPDYEVKYPAGKIREIEGSDAYVRFISGIEAKVSISHLNLQEGVTETVNSVTLILGKDLIEVAEPSATELKPGDVVTVNQSYGIVSTVDVLLLGDTAIVKEVLDGFCEISEGDKSRIVFSGAEKTLEKGDRVVLDPSGLIIVRNNKQQTTDFTVDKNIEIGWNEIGGLEEIKERVTEMVELPHQKPEIFKAYNRKPCRGVLFYGPPGNGKTLIAKAVATSLARIYNGSLTESGFIYIKGPEILNPYVGVTEQTIRSIFERARKHKEKTGYPATIFIDEAEAILSKRGSGISSDVDKTIVPMFLTEMDGLVESAAFIILATNRADRLDSAVIREGRIDVHLEVPPPDYKATKQILLINLKKTLVQGRPEDLAESVASGIFRSPVQENVSGAMIAELVNSAISEAIRRDLKGKGKATGLKPEDFTSAMDKLMKQTRAKEVPQMMGS